jgi:hypothetical protein
LNSFSIGYHNFSYNRPNCISLLFS